MDFFSENWLILTLLGLLFFRDEFMPFLKQKLGFKNGNGQKEDPPAWAKQLQQHYNDETSHLLGNLVDEMRKHNDLEVEVRQTIREIQKYGVDCRKHDKM